MSWKVIAQPPSLRATGHYIVLRMVGNGHHSSTWSALLSRDSYEYLSKTTSSKNGSVPEKIRVEVVQDQEHPTHYGVRHSDSPDAMLVQLRGRTMGATRFRAIVRVLPENGIRIKLTPDGDVLTFDWPPQDMRTVLRKP